MVRLGSVILMLILAFSASAAALIRTGTIIAANIAAGAITGDKIAAGTITADKLSVTDLAAVSAEIGGCGLSASTITCGGTSLDSNGIVIASGSGVLNQLRWSSGAFIYGDGSVLYYDTPGGSHVWEANNVVMSLNSSALVADSTGTMNLGSSAARWNDLHLDGLIRAPTQYGGGGTRYVCVANDGAFFAQDAPC